MRIMVRRGIRDARWELAHTPTQKSVRGRTLTAGSQRERHRQPERPASSKEGITPNLSHTQRRKNSENIAVLYQSIQHLCGALTLTA